MSQTYLLETLWAGGTRGGRVATAGAAALWAVPLLVCGRPSQTQACPVVHPGADLAAD